MFWLNNFSWIWLLQLWDIRKKGCIYTYRVSMEYCYTKNLIALLYSKRTHTVLICVLHVSWCRRLEFRLVHHQQGHKNGVNCVRFSPDGKWIASAGEDGIVKVKQFVSNLIILYYWYMFDSLSTSMMKMI